MLQKDGDRGWTTDAEGSCDGLLVGGTVVWKVGGPASSTRVVLATETTLVT